MLQVKNLTIYYERAEVVSDVSLEVPEASVVALIGPNGAGKTTILTCLSGLKRPSKGQVWFQGKRIDTQSAENIVRTGIGHCPEGRRLFPSMTVLENLKLGAYLTKSNAEINRRLRNVYDRFPVLEKRANQKAGTLSGGEQEMLAIGRTIMQNPKLLLLDEPSFGLSPLLVQELARAIKSISQTGASVLLVEQNARMALAVANYGYVLECGRIRLQGKTEELSLNKEVRKAYLGG